MRRLLAAGLCVIMIAALAGGYMVRRSDKGFHILAADSIKAADSEETEENTVNLQSGQKDGINRLPKELADIPAEYYKEMEDGGTLVNLNYKTYESFSYDKKSEELEKRAVVYLPAGYSEDKKYNVLYLMHGGWSDETVYMGSPERGANAFKHILDHGIANGEIDPLIVVAPTYNNTSPEDSGDYSLAIQLTDQYHNELINDLIPAVAREFSTYAENDSYEAITASRDHRAFAGFSMGSVQTWRTFQYNLDAFRYFMPSSGNAGSSGEAYAELVRRQGYTADDFFIFAASGTDDFAYRSFKYQIEAMAANSMFTVADNEQEGNLYFLEKEGFEHDGIAAMTYFYNGLKWLWKGQTSGTEQPESTEAAAKITEQSESTETAAEVTAEGQFTRSSTVNDVISDTAFGDFGRLLFPVDIAVDGNATLEEISSSDTYVWYSNIQPDMTVEIVNELKKQADSGKQIFYPIYSEEEMAEDSSRQNTGFFFFRGIQGEKFAVMNAGGGFMCVGAMHDSFPHALEASKNGYN
ncbi:MAG: alpha/beta hydrolase-fold protein, partial [Lachnospiraceae bacterium]|nr:alpha/beta hydrolase-fold protein [Lachnospiraceae bacterium]